MPGGVVRSGPDGLESLAESGVGAATTFRETEQELPTVSPITGTSGYWETHLDEEDALAELQNVG